MAGYSIKVTGIPAARAYMQRFTYTASAFEKAVVLVGFRRVYAFGIETGRRRRGRLARAAGGAYMLRAGLRAITPKIKPAIAKTLKEARGPQTALDTLLKLGYQLEAVARPLTPVGKVRGGTLRRDLHTTAGKRVANA